MFALVVAAICSGAREALAELGDGPTEAIGDAKILVWWQERKRAVGMALAVGHRLGVVAAAVLGAVLASQFVEIDLGMGALLVAAMAFVAVACADVLPATIARSRPRLFASIALRLLRLPYLVMLPITKLLLLIRRGLVGVVGAPAAEKETGDAPVWRRVLASGLGLSRERRRLLKSVAEFPTLLVREVMIPRTDMVAISREMNLDEILVTLLECGHSRIPVYGETLDEIEGFFYAKDIIQLLASGREFEIDEFMRQPYFVPETKSISELLTEFQRQRVHLAVVVDEFGGTAGLITLEDIIEEFFGDIQDEYDVEPAQLVSLSADSVLADARIGIDEIGEYFEVEFPVNDEYDSLGGFLLDQMGNVPEIGEEVRWEGLVFRIHDADERRIDTVEIVRDPLDSHEASKMVS